MTTLQYPIGQYTTPQSISKSMILGWINIIENFPRKLYADLNDISETLLNTPYRPGGWTLRQVVHHCADSHLHSFIRLKLTLTENEPTIKPYHEALWAELIDSTDQDINASLMILEGLHIRWTALLKNMSDKDYKRKFFHPDQAKKISLEEMLSYYAWHCDHHLAHIQSITNQRPG